MGKPLIIQAFFILWFETLTKSYKVILVYQINKNFKARPTGNIRWAVPFTLYFRPYPR